MELRTDRDSSPEYDVGILGYWFNKNYGAVLTTYALYKAVEQCGYRPLLLDLPLTMEKIEGDYSNNAEYGRTFIMQNCIVSDPYTHRFQLSNLNQKCKSFLVGSDQLWHTCRNQYRNRGGEFFLDFVDERKKKLSYATSFGDDEFKGTIFDKKILSKLLQRFDEISVREKSAKDICENVFGVVAEVLPDPIFLHNKEFYEALFAHELECNEGGEYLLVYLLHPTGEKQELIKKLAKKKNVDIIVIPDANDNYIKYDGCVEWTVEVEKAISIPRWIELFCNARYVVTDSYHGVLLSIVFEKSFLGLYPRNGAGRFHSLAELLHIEDRVCFQGADEVAFTLLEQKIDYVAIRSTLQEEKDRAWEWIRKNLSSNKGDKDLKDLEIERYRQDTILSVLSRNINARLKQHMHSIKEKNRRLSNEIINNRKLLLCMFLKEMLSGKRVIIRGAGRHTDELIRLLPNDCEILGIVANEVRMSGVEGLEVYSSFDVFENMDIDYVLISSYRYAEEMEAELYHTKYREKIFNIYEELEKKGIIFHKEFYEI